MNANYKSIILAISLFFALSTSISAAPGDLDPTFGSGGIVITRDSNFPQLQYSFAMAIQSDGKIVVVGEGSAGGGNWDFAVVRYNPDGSLDRSFGGSGIVITQLTHNYDGAHSVAIQADGKIVVAGSRYEGTGGSSFAVVRYHPNGSLDTSFNGTGIVITSVSGSGGGSPSSVAIQADGKIVVAGSRYESTVGLSFAVVRYHPNGSLDTSFNGTGIVITPTGSGAVSVAVQGDGKIIAVGGSTVVRYNTDGSLDTTFNGTGKVITAAGDGANSVAIQSDGKIVAAGNSHNGIHQDFAVVRYHPNGSLDSSFGGTGKILIPVGNSDSSADSVVIQTNGKIVVAGIASSNNVVNDFAVVRLNQNGSPDTTFNSSGKVITPVTAGNDIVTGAAIQADGKIVVAGMSDEFLSDFYDFVVVRYQGDAPAACPNPIDCADFFVRQHYRDFLNREPDAGGLAYWTNEITRCGSDARCIHDRRIGVSGAFFVEPEFQETGYFVDRLYQASFGNHPTFAQFNADRALLTVGANLEASKQALAANWVERAAFKNAYSMTMSPDEFVNKLFDTANLRPYTSERQQLATDMRNGKSRAQVLREVIEIPEFKTRQYNPAFVLMQYFGYLRRDVDQGGYDFWLDVLNNREPNNYPGMICSFITSREYQERFGSVVTRSNADCGQ